MQERFLPGVIIVLPILATAANVVAAQVPSSNVLGPGPGHYNNYRGAPAAGSGQTYPGICEFECTLKSESTDRKDGNGLLADPGGIGRSELLAQLREFGDGSRYAD
jgi:hypothetical protein